MLRRVVIFGALFTTCLWMWGCPALAQAVGAVPRTALVFGNAAYSAPDAPLKNPVSDARLMARTLKELGFDVRLRENADLPGMQQALRALESTLRQTKGIGFVYFAGHGVQVMGRNYIVPIGAHLVREKDAQKYAIDADALLQGLRDTGNPLNIVVLDACRNNPLLATNPSRSAGSGPATKPGLAAMHPPEGALVAFSTEPGMLASDGRDAGNGPYTRHLARWLKEPNLTLEQVFKRTRAAVQAETGGTQIPTEYSLLTGADMYLAGGGPNTPSAAQAPVQPNSSPLAASRSVDPRMPPPDTTSARRQLAQLGAGFNKQSWQEAIDNDDVQVFDVLMASGWRVEVQDIVKIIDPRENRWDWPSKIMQSIVHQAHTLPFAAEMCDVPTMARRFNQLPDLLQRGYDSPALDGTRILFHRETLNTLLQPRWAFYQQLCGTLRTVKR
jgi:uncharacterized caspase-like protein